ncbi:Activin types I and II receptor domain-containing protein [Caenorhabditis elegans]|uniref:Activin types I and II receptor domain-containing protein n=1 Tax=Caenorhabditis elegans TaxID=6239 RepID=Q7YX64_CAEEL|nr:Activin types I and II receptor domain-containing protein [Caenorhabditis elegans]CAE17736.1 Activin types I and II receptor domain-containing protein [Caenorhabditis elegans]|eukprot:NP_001024513.1 Uncharacterized protein CELE_D1053.4 [Caenorhabditis elegans]
MASIWRCFLLLTTVSFLANAQSSRQRNNGMVRCNKEIGNSFSSCQGKYCYKMHTPDDTTVDGIVKKGCMNAADAQTEVGKCTRRPLEEGGAELMCVCNERDFCNSALLQSLTISFFVVFVVLGLDVF